MENNLEEKESFTLSEARLILIGQRWAGKSLSGNTILKQDRFECGRTRTSQSEVRHEEVEGRHLVVVDAPGWNSSLSLNETPQGEQQRFKLNVSKCPPGPHVFLLVIPIDTAFCAEQRRILEEHMKLLGERVWRYTMVLFTCGDFLGKKTIEQHIETEGDALKWLVGKCRNRYHVFINKKSRDTSQVTHLLKKIDEMVWHNDGGYYEVDEQTLNIIQEKQQEVAERAMKRRRRTEEQRQQMKKLIPEEKKTIPKLQMVLLGSRGVGKTSVGNAILGIKGQEDGRRTTHSVARQGFVNKTDITVVDTPGWWKDFLECDTSAAIREELKISVFLCQPGPHVFLLMIDSDASFNRKHLEAVKTHLELLGEGVWSHTILVFTRGDWLGAHSIEEYIEGEGEALQTLVERCGNRYHVIDNKNADDGTQVKEMLETITGTVAANNWDRFVPDENMYKTIVEKRVEEGARRRQNWVMDKKKSLEGSTSRLQDLRILMLGQKTFGKSATGNTILRKEVFPTYQNEQCNVEEAEVDGRLVTVIDTPGWWLEPSNGTKEIEREIVRGTSLSPVGVHAVLLVVPLDLTFRHPQKVALEEHMSLFPSSVWKYAIVLFTYGDKMVEKSIEEHIEKEHSALRWLVDKCENRYHVMSNIKKNDSSQVTELFEKIEEMMADHSSHLFRPDMSDILERLMEKFKRRQIKLLLKNSFEEKYRRRELELLTGFRETLLKLQSEVRGGVTSSLPRSKVRDLDRFKIKGIGQSKKDEREENLDAKISSEIENLNKDIMRCTDLLGKSMDLLIPAWSVKVGVKVGVSVWPPGSNMYLHESVLLRCSAHSNSSATWSFKWFRLKPHPASTPSPRHLLSGDSYSVTAVTREDEGSYQCRAEQRETNVSAVVLLSRPLHFRVTDTAPPSLTLTPSSRHIFRGRTFSVRFPGSLTRSSGWTLRRFPPGPAEKRGAYTDSCSPLGGASSAEQPDTCVFNAAKETSGLYWCEGAKGRSNAVSITVSYGSIILRTPASPVSEGDAASLICQYWTGNNVKTTFFKNGSEILASASSISGGEIKMTIENVTQEDEGFYKCASADGRMESPESWLSVRLERGNATTTEGTAASAGSWSWIAVVLIFLLLLLIPVSVWLVRQHRYQTVCTCRCWPVSKEELPAVDLPETKQDVTEVQWDLSWMEMSNLLDINVDPDTEPAPSLHGIFEPSISANNIGC